MHPLAAAVDMFEGESERLLWLPALTVGYVYTLSGEPAYFALAVIGVGGAKLFSDIIDSDLVEQTPDGPVLHDGAFKMIRSSYPLGKTWLFALVGLTYIASALVGVYGLYAFFDHSNLILVALAVVWGGSALIVLFNI